MIKTDSIKEMLKISSNIDSLSINRFDIDGNILNVDFKDLLEFKDLKTLRINKCTLNAKDMTLIISLKNLSSLTLDNVTFADDMSNVFPLLEIDELSLINIEGLDFNLLNNIKLNKLIVKGMEIPNLNLNVTNLDLTHSKFNKDVLLNMPLKSLTISEKEYQKDENFYNTQNYKVIIMEDHTNFVLKEVGVK